MFDPSRIILNTRLLMIIRWEATDRNGPAPLSEILNLRRYSVTLWPGTSRYHVIVESPYQVRRRR